METLDPANAVQRQAYEYLYGIRSGDTLSLEAWEYLLNVVRVTPQRARENANPNILRELENRGLLGSPDNPHNIRSLEVEIPEGATILGITQDNKVVFLPPF